MMKREIVLSRISFKRLDDSGIQRAWEELADSTSAGPFARSGWFRAWADAFDRKVEVAVTEDGSALIPVIREGHAVTSATNEHSPELVSVCASDVARQHLFRDLLAEGYPSYHLMRVGTSDVAAMRGAVRGERMVDEVVQRSPYLDLAGDWDSYEMSLNARFRQGLRRKARRLMESGEVDVEFIDDASGLDQKLREGFAIEGSGWKNAAGTAIASDPRALAFYNGVARWAAERGWLRLWSLKLDDHAIAFRFDLEVAGVYYHLKGGYDRSFGRYSPGLLLQHSSVQEAFHRGLNRYEFLGADEDYKLKWTKTTHERHSIRIFRKSARGTLVWLDRAVARPAAKRMLARATRHH